MEKAQVWIAGEWRESQSAGEFQAQNPATGENLPRRFPISSREEVLAAVSAGALAAEANWDKDPTEFLEAFASGIEANADELVRLANEETGLPVSPRLKDVELPRTVDQLRQAASTSRSGVWRNPIKDADRGIYSVRAPLGGPVVVFGPNNFPFAYNGVSGGDFAAAIASNNPVIAKPNPAHPATSELLAKIAFEALQKTDLHPATVQMIYEMPREVGLELVAHPLVGATAFTGSRPGGLKLKEAADKAGKPIYLEMSSVNPVIILEGALKERGAEIAQDFFASATMGTGQFCTSPGLIVLPDSEAGRAFVQACVEKYQSAQAGVLLTCGVRDGLHQSIDRMKGLGAEMLIGGQSANPGYRFQPTIFQVPGGAFLNHPAAMQEEAFGPVSLLVLAEDAAQIAQIVKQLEGNLTGSIYSAKDGADDGDYWQIEPHLRRRVGRLLNDKMPTGVAVSPAMNHGGPYPATGHPGFTAVGFPTTVERFTALHCYDAVRTDRLPAALRDEK